MNNIKKLNSLLMKLPIWVLYILLALPAFYITYLLLTNQLGPDPIRSYERKIGEIGFKLLILVLLITPFRDLTKINLIKFRRAFGLMVFFYICLHFSSYVILDQGLNMNELWVDLVKRPYITLGMISAVLMFFLAITSNNLSIRKLGLRKWKYLHKLIYLIGVGGALHYLLLTKTWQIEPIVYCIVIIILLLYRIMKVRRN